MSKYFKFFGSRSQSEAPNTHKNSINTTLPKAPRRVSKRAVGYCVNTDCPEWCKNTVLINCIKFYCPRCRVQGGVEEEKSFTKNNLTSYKEVRIEYNFNPVNSIYHELLILRDESITEGNVYTLMSPLIKIEKRAEKVANALFANLQFYTFEDGFPVLTETILNIAAPKEEFMLQLREWEDKLENSNLCTSV